MSYQQIDNTLTNICVDVGHIRNRNGSSYRHSTEFGTAAKLPEKVETQLSVVKRGSKFRVASSVKVKSIVKMSLRFIKDSTALQLFPNIDSRTNIGASESNHVPNIVADVTNKVGARCII